MFEVANRKFFINDILRWPPAAILYIKRWSFNMLNAEHGANRIIRLEVIQLFVNFQITPMAILDFRKCTSGAQRCLGGDEC